ncbi:galactose-binding protein [Wolffia australiana]
MPRSRRPTAQRRIACEQSQLSRNNLCRVMLLLWGLVSISSFVFSLGNGRQDETEVLAKSEWPEFNATHSIEDLEFKQDENVSHSELGTDKIIKIEDVPAGQEKVEQTISNINPEKERETLTKNEDRPSRIKPPGLDEFKSKTVTAKGKQTTNQVGSIVHRLEPGGKEYNYASAAKGAKVLAFNKEAKGGSNILDKDKDKYLRNPCSVEEKFIIIELSEETLVDTIEIVNFEHYSSNLKDFELLSSLVYPTASWVSIGNFTASNVKHVQRFVVQEPKWTRYLKLNLLTHYGSEFYCTLSALEVYGVDAVERMLEDLRSEEPKDDEVPAVDSLLGDDHGADPAIGSNFDQLDAERESVSMFRHDGPKGSGRMPGDTVLKILMQKIQYLVASFSVLERYLEELNGRYGQILKELDSEIREVGLQVVKIKEELENLHAIREELSRDTSELMSWKFLASRQLESLVNNNVALRLEMEGISARQAEMEGKGLAVIFVSFMFASFAVLKLMSDALLSISRFRRLEKFCSLNTSWIVLLLSCVIVTSILIL